jgi:hypothetical protein
VPNSDFDTVGRHFQALSPRFQRISTDALRQTAALNWAERLFFLAAAGEKHETWRTAYALRYMDEQVPEWPEVVSAVIELWAAPGITCFEMAAIYTTSSDRDWRMAGETWCVSCGCREQLAAYWADPVGHAGNLVGRTLDELDRLAG